jgi:hypothetical protein
VDKTFAVVEYSCFFAVRHNPSGDEHPMVDGVDSLFDQDEKALTPGFSEAWEEALNADKDETLQAYFPQQTD